MFKKSLSLLAAALVCTPLLAQEQPKVVGKTDGVKGLVTVSFGTNVSTVTGVIPILDKSRFVTASTGYATLKFDDGCDVRLEPNQAYTVEGDRSCAARLLLVHPAHSRSDGWCWAHSSTSRKVESITPTVPGAMPQLRAICL